MDLFYSTRPPARAWARDPTAANERPRRGAPRARVGQPQPHAQGTRDHGIDAHQLVVPFESTGLSAAIRAYHGRMPDVRGWWLACAALACAVAPPLPSTPPPAIPPMRSDPVVSYGWEPLRPVHPADLITPAVRDAASCDAAAEAASAAGVLDVAAYWRAEAHALTPTPARAEASTAARVEAGLTDPVVTITTLAPDLAARLRSAVEAHAWDEVLALARPALASQPHHELYFWAGDALWQQGHEAAARRMWSRARVLLRAAGMHPRPRLPLSLSQESLDVGWTAAGLALARGQSKPWIEVWGDRLERPWRRWQIARADDFAWSAAAIATLELTTLTLYDPASGARLAADSAVPDNFPRIAAASQAPVFAVGTSSGAVEVWRWTPGLPLETIFEHPRVSERTSKRMILALDPQGTRLAFQLRGQPVQLVSLPSGATRRVTLPDHGWSSLRLVDADTLLLDDDAGALTRVRLVDGADEVMILRDAAAKPRIELITAAATGELAVYDVDRTALATCGALLEHCRDRVIGPGILRSFELDGYFPGGEVRFAPDGRRLAVARRVGLAVHDLDGETTSTTTLIPAVDPNRKLVGVRHDGAALVVEGERGLAVWDTKTGAQRLVRDRRGFLGFSPDGARVAIRADQPPRLEIAALTGDEPLMIPLGEHKVHAARFAPDGRRVAIVAGERIGVWDATTGAELWSELRPERVRSLEFTARDELVYSTGDTLAVRDAAGDAAPRLLARNTDGFHDWSVSPDGAELLVCPDQDVGSTLLDITTRRVRRKFRRACTGMFLDADAAFIVTDMHPGVLDLRTGKRTPVESRFVYDPLHTDGRVVVSGAFGEYTSLTVLTRDGQELVRLRPRDDLGWFAVTPEGAVDGDPRALSGLDAEVGRGLLQRYPAALVWDGVHVPGLVARAFTGERVVPPVPR